MAERDQPSRIKPRPAEGGEESRPQKDLRRQIVVDMALKAVDQIILEMSDGSVEETDYLTAQVMLEMTKKVHGRITSELLRYDLKIPRMKDGLS